MRFPLLLTLLACRCPSGGTPTAGHYEAVGELRDAVYRGDAGALLTAARAMDGGDAAARGDAGAEGRLHGALGFLLVAEDAEERGEGLAAVARACGDCHRAAGVRAADGAPSRGPCPQAAATEAAWWALVGGEGTAQDEARLAEGAGGCVECHRGAARRGDGNGNGNGNGRGRLPAEPPPG
ncbi:MAG: hypothetical protein ABIO70_35115 [Pseudomonadota bacterium]